MERTLLEYVRRSDETRDARVAAANVGLEASSYEWAVDVLVPAFDATPSDQEVAELLAEAYDNLQRSQEEQQVYERWAMASENPAQALLVVGALYIDQAEDELAEAAFRRVFDDALLGAEARFLLAELYTMRGRLDEADALFAACVLILLAARRRKGGMA